MAMFLVLDTPRVVNQNITHLQINGFSVDFRRQMVICSFDEGYVSGGPVFLNEDRTIIFEGVAYTNIIASMNTEANAMPAGQVNVGDAVRRALYTELQTVLGETGTVVET